MLIMWLSVHVIGIIVIFSQKLIANGDPSNWITEWQHCKSISP